MSGQSLSPEIAEKIIALQVETEVLLDKWRELNIAVDCFLTARQPEEDAWVTRLTNHSDQDCMDAMAGFAVCEVFGPGALGAVADFLESEADND